MDFCAIDFETATHEKSSACEMGICVVQDSKIVETKTWLIKPPSFPYFSRFNIAVHGIHPEDVKDAPTFRDIASKVMEMLTGSDLGGFNSNRFDVPLLAEELLRVGMDFDLSKFRLVDAQTIFHKKNLEI